MTSEKRAQKFPTDDTQIWVVLLIGWIKFPTWQDQSEALPRSDLGYIDASSVWNFCSIFSDIICRETSGSLNAKCWLFSQASSRRLGCSWVIWGQKMCAVKSPILQVMSPKCGGLCPPNLLWTPPPPSRFLLRHLCASSGNMSGVIIMAFQVYCGFMLFNMIRPSRRGNLLTFRALCHHQGEKKRALPQCPLQSPLPILLLLFCYQSVS